MQNSLPRGRRALHTTQAIFGIGLKPSKEKLEHTKSEVMGAASLVHGVACILHTQLIPLCSFWSCCQG